jgi:hypothetical protein
MLTDQPDANAFMGSLAEQSDRRGGSRYMTVLRVAKLETRRGQELCLVRNISGGGLMANIYSNLKIDDRVVVEFKAEHRFTGRVVWRRDNQVGVQFDETADVSSLLNADESVEGLRARSPRIDVDQPARLRCGARYHAVTLSNISQSGAGIASGDTLEAGAQIVLTIPDLPPVSGVVRWYADGHAGIAFDERLRLDLLAQWVVSVQRAPMD